MPLSIAARQIVRVRGHGAARIRRVGKKEVGVGTGGLQGELSQSVSQGVCNIARIMLGQKIGVGRVLIVALLHHLLQSSHDPCDCCIFQHTLEGFHLLYKAYF